MQRRHWMTAMLAGAAGLAGCGGGPDRTKANLRFVNASSGYAALDFWVGDERRRAAVAYGQAESYAELDPDAREMRTEVRRADAATPLVTLTPAVAKREFYTLLAWGREGALKVNLLDENAGEPDGSKAHLRIFNAAVDAGALDVYLTAEADALADAVAFAADVAVGATGDYVAVNAGTWRLRVTGAGTRSDLRLDLGGLTLDSRQTVTLVVTPGAGGMLVNALVLVQEGPIAVKANVHARVRVVAGVPGSAAVTATVGGQTLLNAVAAPAIGAYVLVPAGEQPVAVSVAGTALAATPVTLAAGTDHTLLVHTPSSTPAASWLADDNRLPDASGMAKLRLVHGMAGGTGAMSLTADGTPVAGGVGAGTASDYAEVPAGTSVDLNAVAEGLDIPVYSSTEDTLVAGSVHTLFVLAGPSPARVFLRQDR